MAIDGNSKAIEGNFMVFDGHNNSIVIDHTVRIRLVKFQPVRQIPDVYVSACVLAHKLILLFFLVLLYFS